MSSEPHPVTHPSPAVGPLHRLYHWMIWKAKTPHAQFFLFAIAFMESSFFPLPPDVLLMAMVLANRERWRRYFLICLSGSVFGGMAGYGIGWGVWQVVDQWFFAHIFSEATFEKVRDLYARYDFWVVFTAAFTPIPYKVFTIAAGVAHLNLPSFIVASIAGRGGRFILVAFLLHRFGPGIRIFLEKYLNLITIVFTVVLIGGFVAIKYIAH
ncbi:MAG TPA: YqaA family protein [bacterium]|nr:YqaA family protein [bacterium]